MNTPHPLSTQPNRPGQPSLAGSGHPNRAAGYSDCAVYLLSGVIFGILGLKSTQRGLAIAGIVLSALTLPLTIILTIAGISLASLGIDLSNFDPNQWLPQY